MKADIGLIGLAVMGENLVMNMERNGYTVAVYNRDTSKVDRFIEGRAAGKKIVGTHSAAELVASLSCPRMVMMMIKAGSAVDMVISQVAPLLERGDILIDGGNSHYPDTQRRMEELRTKGILYVGTGISGGEEGALNGPSIMPGGSEEAWPHIGPIFRAISAKAGADQSPCCVWIGDGGAGHFVKMVHNGIEYGDMQLICEAYAVMRDALGMTADEMYAVFDAWNRSELDSYLIEITRDILAAKDADGSPLVDKILDAAGQKGTGKWTSVAALDEAVPLTLITEAVYARCLSALKEERVHASRLIPAPVRQIPLDKAAAVEDLRSALFASKIVSYAQGYALLSSAAKTYGWTLDMGAIAMIWRGGCIIRSAFLNNIRDAYQKDPKLSNLMLDPFFCKVLNEGQSAWRRSVALAVTSGIAVPAMSSALAYFDGYRTENLPANLLQAQRDYFGAHQFERTDRPRGEFFHYNWTGRGGDTKSSTYNA